jgi:hypothetical protein
MSLSFSLEQFKLLFVARNHAEDSQQIADKIASQCLGEIVDRIDQAGEPWSAVQIRGYLRAMALPRIEAALEANLVKHKRLRGDTTDLQTVTLDKLEHMVVEKLKKPAIRLSTGSAAA